MKVTGAGIGRQFADGRYEWRVRYEGNRGLFFRTVPSSRAGDPQTAMQIVARELGLPLA